MADGGSPAAGRSQARILAMQALCVFETVGDSFADDLDGFLRDGVRQADMDWRRRPALRVVTFARQLARGAWAQRERADKLLTDSVPDWSVGRMQPVDRNILRIGLYELLECPETPFAVVINEAIELARQFGGADSPAFVNGVLDGLRKRLLPDTDATVAPLETGDARDGEDRPPDDPGGSE